MNVAIDWTTRRNAWSEAVLSADRLDDLLPDLDCELRRTHEGRVYRGKCPIHLGDGESFQMRVGGHTLPIRWSCFSQTCQEKYKGSFLGFVRGVLSARKGKEVGLTETEKYLKDFLGSTPNLKTTRRPSRPE